MANKVIKDFGQAQQILKRMCLRQAAMPFIDFKRAAAHATQDERPSELICPGILRPDEEIPQKSTNYRPSGWTGIGTCPTKTKSRPLAPRSFSCIALAKHRTPLLIALLLHCIFVPAGIFAALQFGVRLARVTANVDKTANTNHYSAEAPTLKATLVVGSSCCKRIPSFYPAPEVSFTPSVEHFLVSGGSKHKQNKKCLKEQPGKS